MKFTEEGYVKVTLGLVPGPGSSQLLRLMVEDTGTGISGDQLDKLFLPFSQAKPSVVRKFGGTGLGLAICKMLASSTFVYSYRLCPSFLVASSHFSAMTINILIASGPPVIFGSRISSYVPHSAGGPDGR